MTLDLGTLHFASAASRCAYVLVFLVMALSQRGQTYLWHWMGVMGLSMAGSLIMMRVPQDSLPPIPITMLTYWLYAGSLVLSWTGFRSFFGRPVPVGLSVVLVAVPGLIFPLLLAAGFSERVALAAVFANCLGLALLSAYETMRRSDRIERLWSQYIEFVAFAFYALVFVLTIGMLLGTDLPIASAQSARASMILDQITGVFVYFGYVAMTAERANRSLLRLAETDPLTGLLNRRGLHKALRRRFPVPGPQSLGGVLILDIDHFKSINDRHGHEGGDIVLAEFALRMRTALRSTDVLARWGGEEFLVVLPGASPQELAVIAERLRGGIAAQPFALPACALPVTISIGTAVLDADIAAFETVTQEADAALYVAKAGGRNRVCHAPVSAPAPPAPSPPDAPRARRSYDSPMPA